ncbi:type II toxin-antitoxin system PemK/MazF family toxin [Reichenbachiella carrageenanivorans]|uniref:Type II toxin-antitoxin system PemK/MazF family toxin n=1 Tax=Reichenbachiella carrageenanivorans TaxID=2979869 RepID=A0ABY6CVF8_9BACT|nr:type II toxin-antitoxin system PemK/MazF family toxin [Reichenbachiella carrageenanivorans]UXX77891.1 type II toxin-antitoxin system PemK/MazF family toxin [Reichenbachiella carrageenanivorans]
MELDQYRIVLVNLDPIVGSEIQKTRPCVIISPNELNFNIKTITIAPMTTKSHSYPTRIQVNQNKKTGWIILDQIRTIDKQRVIKSYSILTPKEVSEVKRVIKETFVD